MKHLLQITILALGAATLPTSIVQAAPHGHKHRAVETQLEMGTASASTSTFAPGISNTANFDNKGISDARGAKLDLGSNEPGKLGLNQINAAVPEPSTWVMIGVGGVLLAAVQRFRTKR